MENDGTASTATRVLLVDDNRIYREAFRRNLMLQNYDVTEAENMQQALEQVEAVRPDVVITDLQMRTETEGLDLIQAVKLTQPLLPIIMISAVGTFEEGAQAQKFGASAVLSKSRIEDDIERLYSAVDKSRSDRAKAQADEAVVAEVRKAAMDEAGGGNPDGAALRKLIVSPETHPYIRREAFDLEEKLAEAQRQEDARTGLAKAEEAGNAGGMAALNMKTVEDQLREVVPAYDSFTDDTKESLRIAEFLYDQQTRIQDSIDFSRNVGFSYCFAVENEVKARLAKRLHKLLSSETTYGMIREMMEPNFQGLSVYFHQHLLLLLRGREMDFTIDNVKQTLRRIVEHQSRYKPDGLKALGIMLIAFGRNFSWQKGTKKINIHNPLALKGLDTEADTMRFAELLVNLQHYRNPYIHPEISDMEKLSIIRQAAVECLNMASRIS